MVSWLCQNYYLKIGKIVFLVKQNTSIVLLIEVTIGSKQANNIMHLSWQLPITHR
jgi:hypothetical protein